jgi:hypothetical protein
MGPACLLLDELESGMINGRGAEVAGDPTLENGSELEGRTMLEAGTIAAT